jgi:hypothetical protein
MNDVERWMFLAGVYILGLAIGFVVGVFYE